MLLKSGNQIIHKIEISFNVIPSMNLISYFHRKYINKEMALISSAEQLNFQTHLQSADSHPLKSS